ncbi:MAG TPA: sulfate ABC transporter substrate-binding protein [Candidatus Methylacidiphilales bacterium]
MKQKIKLALLTLVALGAWAISSPAAKAKTIALLNVSYDPTRELYQNYNTVFAAYWKKQTGDDVTINQSHGGSGKQARSVIDGLGADVVTLATAQDIDAIAKEGMVAPDWQTRLPNDSSPYTSTIVLLVRKGNPKAIKDWPDVIRPGVEAVAANPKTGGGARWNYLAAYGYALETNNRDDAKARAFVTELYGKHIKVLDSGARGTTVTFVERGQGDVLIGWENEALLIVNKLAPGQFEIIYPSQSILAEPPVAVVDANVDKHGTREVTTAYLKYLYSPEGQDVVARYYYRPQAADVLAKYSGQFHAIKLFTLKDLFGSWAKVQKEQFGDGGVFDQIYSKPSP